jgi:hypothetical protein
MDSYILYPTNSNLQFSLQMLGKNGIALLSVKDTRTGVVVRTALPSNSLPYASLVAFAGARYSRSDASVQEIFSEVVDHSDVAEKKLASIFRGYGHASVADMALLFCYIENISSIHALRFFYETSVGAGQERSTRYQNFARGVSPIPLQQLLPNQVIQGGSNEEFSCINNQLLSLQSTSLALFNKWTAKLTEEYSKVFTIDKNNQRELSALKARVFDTARAFLLSGLSHRTSLAWVTSAREWARLIALFKGDSDPLLNCLAEQIEALLAPEATFAKKIGYVAEAAELIRYTNADETTSSVLDQLHTLLIKYKAPFLGIPTSFKRKEVTCHVDTTLWDTSIGLKTLTQLCLEIAPWANTKDVFGWLSNCSPTIMEDLSNCAFAVYTHHNQMGSSYRTNQCSFEITCSISEIRDLNRHRAWGRFIPILSCRPATTALRFGDYVLPLYISHHPQLKQIGDEFSKDLECLFDQAEATLSMIEDNVTWLPSTLALQCIPFAQTTPFHMHGSVKELSYFTQLRVRPGGHINYRLLSHEIASEAAGRDSTLRPLLRSVGSQPDATSRAEFIDRS